MTDDTSPILRVSGVEVVNAGFSVSLSVDVQCVSFLVPKSDNNHLFHYLYNNSKPTCILLLEYRIMPFCRKRLLILMDGIFGPELCIAPPALDVMLPAFVEAFNRDFRKDLDIIFANAFDNFQ